MKIAAWLRWDFRLGDTLAVDAGLRASRGANADARYEATRHCAMQAFARGWHRET